ncbi:MULTISPECIES: tyrosine recombinase XerC [Providencia]|uniref:Tyrosine recombinase XerC n=1 Tax=Providencia heimbachae ATCC 35613 TaxID=1354272 RepID=A0A1B7JVG8_9GAMM|nr:MULTISPECIES: tyrosine recombinase XerC [Providencia]MBP6123673.1 tyrosine recombinase XerC [Providencia sp.]MDD9340724.1 tyrosine recombinase XerC [Providencia heimbachae]NIH24313.1 tyrosine recombinase XerC [Providencia heimbachae]OAT51888.1 XerC family tyrosine recombinase [Providencia heimbachae ATCC 35613]QCJ71696.1 tyrosine recombinase XerC [Providencia heimbachae]
MDRTSVSIQPNGLDDQIEAFLRYLRVERRLSPVTITNYRRQLSAVTQILSELKVTQWQQLDTAIARNVAAKSRRTGLQAASMALRLSSLRSFCDWMVQQGELPANPVKSIQAPKAKKRLPKNMDVDEVFQLLNMDSGDPLVVRDRTMLEVMYGAGLRLSELVGLDVKHLDLDLGEVLVMGKGSKERKIPVGKTAVSWLKRWLEMRELYDPEDGAVFISTQSGKRISNRNVQKRFEQWGIKQGVNSHINPHKLRHSFATHILESSGNLRGVQELLGHANLSTTQIYTHLDFQHLASVYDVAHPRAKREKP